MDQCLQHTASSKESSHEDIDGFKSAEATWSDNNSGGFDCNICLDLVQDPVVTFCGHLYCWPCIYKWLQSDKTSSEDPNKQHQCPICKAGISQNTLIPLYAGVQSGKPSKCTDLGLVIPQRPAGPHCGAHTQTTSSSTGSHPHPTQPQLQHHGGYLGYYSPPPAFGFAGTTTFHPMIGMFGEMIHARLSGNPQAAVYTYPNAYSSVSTASSSGRDRRIVMQAEKSLSRVSFFLFCCIMLCLLLF